MLREREKATGRTMEVSTRDTQDCTEEQGRLAGRHLNRSSLSNRCTPISTSEQLNVFTLVIKRYVICQTLSGLVAFDEKDKRIQG